MTFSLSRRLFLSEIVSLSCTKSHPLQGVFSTFSQYFHFAANFQRIFTPLHAAVSCKCCLFRPQKRGICQNLGDFHRGAAHFSPPGTHDRELSALIGYNLFPITADHHRAGIKRPRSAASRRGMKGGNMRGKGQNPLSGIIVPHSPFNDRLFTLCSHKWRQMSHLVRICRT